MPLSKRALAEFLGTFWLTFGGCGSAVIAAAFPQVGIGLLGVSLAFGLTVLTMAYALGAVSGAHLNPAVSIGLASARRFPMAELPAYIVAQILGGIAGATVLYSPAADPALIWRAALPPTATARILRADIRCSPASSRKRCSFSCFWLLFWDRLTEALPSASLRWPSASA